MQHAPAARARSARRCPASSCGSSTSTAGRLEGDDPGEIQVRGANLFSGYWPDGSGGPDAEGWWSTGDVGYLDASGDLFLVDRVRELVIVSGFNVYPSEVEDVIREVDRVARGRRDRRRGRARPARRSSPTSWRGRRRRRAEVEAAVRALRGTRLARFKQPARIEVVDDAAADRHRQGPEGPAARHRAPPRPGAPGVEPHGSRSGRRVTLYGRAGLPPVRGGPGVIAAGLRRDRRRRAIEVDVDDDPALQDRFDEEVPVTFVDGRQHDFWRVDEARLRAALRPLSDLRRDPRRGVLSHMW